MVGGNWARTVTAANLNMLEGYLEEVVRRAGELGGTRKEVEMINVYAK